MNKLRYIFLAALVSTFYACDVDNDLEEIKDAEMVYAEADAGTADFSKYVSVGASFTAGFADNALFVATQVNSFPNIIAGKMAHFGGGEFHQPLMNDNDGGLLFMGQQIQAPRLIFGGAGPIPLPGGMPTTEVTNRLSGPFNNFGVPGAKSFHMVAPGYGSMAGVPAGLANPYFARMATSDATTVLADAMAQQPTFFTVSEIGGNDVLGYAISGGSGMVQNGNLDPSTYGSNDITDPNVFASAFNGIVQGLTSGGAKGAIVTIPSIVNLPHFTTVPHNPLDPSNPAFGPQIATLNQVYGAINQVLAAYQETDRMISFSTTEASAVVIKDENLTDYSAQIAGALGADPNFALFIQQFGLPAQAAPMVAGLLGQTYGQARQATADDFFVLPSSSVIGTVNTDVVAALMGQGLSQEVAGMFAVEGVSLPLEDKWVLTPEEKQHIAEATDAYNATITAIGQQYGLAVVDLNGLLTEAATTGAQFDEFIMTTDLVFGGLVSLDGIHLTSRGYAIMANKILEGIDATYGSNFKESGNLAKAANYSTNYPAGI